MHSMLSYGRHWRAMSKDMVSGMLSSLQANLQNVKFCMSKAGSGNLAATLLGNIHRLDKFTK